MPPWFLRPCWADGTQHEAKRFSMMPRPYTRRTGLKGPSDYGQSFIENGQIFKGEIILSIFTNCTVSFARSSNSNYIKIE